LRVAVTRMPIGPNRKPRIKPVPAMFLPEPIAAAPKAHKSNIVSVNSQDIVSRLSEGLATLLTPKLLAGVD